MSVEREHMYSMLQQVNELQQRGDVDLETALREINASSVASIPGARYGGITMVEEAGINTLAATHDYATVLDDIQRDAHEGPCLSAAWDQHTIRIDDLASETRWPRYRDAAIERTPVRSVISFRLFQEGSALAALNFYAESEGVFDEESVEVGLIFAAHTTVAWNLMRREHQFRSALASRDVIGQAKGVLMERFSIDAAAAFELLRKLSQQSNTKLVDVAERLIALDHPPQ